MTKNETMHEILREYETLSDTKKEEFSRITNRLLAVNFLCGGRKKDRNDFYYISSYEKLFHDFFTIIDYRFILNKVDQVAYISSNRNYNHMILTQLYSVVLLLLRKLYFQKSQELQDSDFINISVGELHAEIEATGLYDKRINKTELKDVYSFLSKYNICERIGELNEDETRLIIYPTINYVLPISTIEDITNKINTYKKGDEDENIDESESD
ncbi:DUF4194 domain-containing protein [Amedibacillus sp. YH-ame6]